MFTSLNIGSAALTTYSKAMDSVSSNISNMNTVGYKGTHVEFSAQFSQGQNQQGAFNGTSVANGVTTTNVVNFAPGDYVETKDTLHVAAEGGTFFVLKDSKGDLHYTKNGQFHIQDGFLVGEGGARVQGINEAGNMADIAITGDYASSPSAVTTTLSHNANAVLSLNEATVTMQPFNVYDPAGGVWQLNVKYTRIDATPPSTEKKWKAEVLDKNNNVLQTDIVQFTDDGRGPVSTHTSFSFTYKPGGSDALAVNLKLDYANLATLSGPSSAAQITTDGRPRGVINTQEFIADGSFKITYSNGQTNNKQVIALARFQSVDQLRQTDGGTFVSSAPPSIEKPGENGNRLRVGFIEKSNVDMSAEFAEMIKIQRCYQAVSQIVSTANQMIDTTLSMKRGA